MTETSSPASSDVLRGKLTMCTGPLDMVFQRLWASEAPDQMVPSFLVMLHQIMRASVPVDGGRHSQVRRVGGGGPDRKSLSPDTSPHHIDEERNHDVWALEDLANVGYAPEAVVRLIPPPAVARLAGAQRYWVEHHHPLMLLGCIAVLESFPPPQETIDQMRDASGLPEAAFRTMRLHGKLDPYHSAELFEFIDTLPLTRDHLDMIGTSLVACMESLTETVSEPQTHRTIGPAPVH